ncbi:FecR family protein [Dyadobacter fanqingshengii]|uniref:FecR domain-containing protein n=1 Tax=Dyadobacter fanqingshengii TaxID=2906443 RepID=A0A9X1TGF8_9BACT|nr:FecR family protein [Dyadobacter fanqingshengii]MCF0040387.1 FecR domain-containing protein [Dyadobacter fanqingshengii]USJ37870.1 FecR domain-containing protein [Dyadobacter fanqingshengii]
MNNYKNFEVKDWVDDPGFRKWVYEGAQDAFWVTVLENTPSQVENMEQARKILLMVRGEVTDISEQELAARKSELLEFAAQEKQIRSWWRGRWFQAAAVLLITLGFGGYHWKRIFPAPYNAVLTQSGTSKIIEIINEHNEVKLVTLPDGSSVILKKAAKISFPEKFSADKREVVMSGEAFFEVQKDPVQPFYIYSGEMLTKVTGTSFSIKANAAEKQVQLVVKTGTVEISVNSSDKETKDNRLILNPNQLVTLNRESSALETRNVKEPVLINLPIESQYFTFKKTPVKEVFRMLELAYGVHINFDKQVTSQCNITASLGDEPVREKLQMICEVLDARFEMKDNAIIVYSEGCEK